MPRLLLAALLLSPSAPGAAPRMARDQIFFAGGTPPTLLALVVQRVEGPAGVVMEVKGFLAWEGIWRSPFYARIHLGRWPADLGEAVRAWQTTGEGRHLRLTMRGTAHSLTLNVRRPSGGLTLRCPRLRRGPALSDPHGPTQIAGGLGTLTVNGRALRGQVLVERMAEATTVWPRFERFEMWVGADGAGLVLSRRPGEAARVGLDGAVRSTEFSPRAEAWRVDPGTGLRLPTAWSVGAGGRWRRTGGATTRGTAPDGGPAVYDLSVARAGPTRAALVFHLQDAPSRSPAARGTRPGLPSKE